MRLVVWASLVALGLAGCAPTLANGNAAGGIVQNVGRKGSAFKIAEDHCRQYGMLARVSGEDIWNNTLNFDCVPPPGR